MKTPAIHPYRKWARYFIFVLAGVLIAWIISNQSKVPAYPNSPRDFAEIDTDGVLRAVIEYETLSLHAAGDSLGGLQWELLDAFARYYGWQLQVYPEMEFSKRLQGLMHGSYDLIATAIPVNSTIRDSILLSHPILTNHQVLVQRKASSDQDSLYIKSQLDLGGKTVHVVKGSPALMRIHNLAGEIGDTIFIQEVERYGSEQLIFMVAHGDIDYVVCDESTASAAQDSFPQLDTRTAIGFTQFYSWGVNKTSHVLIDSLNTWLDHYKTTPEGIALYRRYGMKPGFIPKSLLRKR